MPAIDHAPDRRGRRPIALDQAELERVAVLVDLAGFPLKAYARAVAWPDEDWARDRVRSELRSARRALRELGVLPWVCFDQGAPPPTWWETSAFTIAIRRWQLVAAMHRDTLDE